MSISTKLNLSFGSFILLLCISVVVSVLNLNSISGKIDEALDRRVVQIIEIEQIRYGLAMQGLAVREVIIDNTASSKDELELYKNAVDTHINTLSELSTSDTMKGYLQEVTEYNNNYNTNLEKALKTVEDGNREQALAIVNGALADDNEKITELADKMFEYQSAQVEDINKQTDSTISSSKTVSIVVLIISMLISILLMFYVKRTITNPLRTVVNSVNVVSTGDLTEDDLKIRTRDEIGQLSKGFNTMKNNLKVLITNVQQSTEHLSAAAEELSASTEEITASSDDVTKRVESTSEQAKTSAHAAFESARAMDETAVGVQRIAESTQLLHNSSLETSDTATHGTTILQQAEQQMGTISHSTTLVNDLVQRLSKQTEEIEIFQKL